MTAELDLGWRAAPRGYPLSRAHALAKGLLTAWVFNAYSDTFVPDLANGKHITTLTTPQTGSGAMVIASPSGAAYAFPTSSNGSGGTMLSVGDDPLLTNLAQAPMSIALRGRFGDLGGASPGGPGLLVGKAASGSVAQGWGILYDPTINALTFWVGAATTTMKAPMLTSSVTAGTWYSVVLTYGASGGSANAPLLADVNFYLNGSSVGLAAGTAGAGAPVSDATFTVKIGGDGTANFTSANCALEYVYVYNRQLSQAEAQQIAVQPYVIFQPPVQRRDYWSVAPAVAASPDLLAWMQPRSQPTDHHIRTVVSL